MLYYTGVGSRGVSIEIQNVLKNVATYLAKRNCVLRSGGANGSDKAFEIGCDRVNGKKEIYLPWEGFNNSKSDLIVKKEAFDIARQYHPTYSKLSSTGKKLHARNSHQVLGYDLKSPSDFVIAYCPNESGGTMQAIRLAEAYNIPLLNIGPHKTVDDMVDELDKFLDNFVEK